MKYFKKFGDIFWTFVPVWRWAGTQVKQGLMDYFPREHTVCKAK